MESRKDCEKIHRTCPEADSRIEEEGRGDLFEYTGTMTRDWSSGIDRPWLSDCDGTTRFLLLVESSKQVRLGSHDTSALVAAKAVGSHSSHFSRSSRLM